MFPESRKLSGWQQKQKLKRSAGWQSLMASSSGSQPGGRDHVDKALTPKIFTSQVLTAELQLGNSNGNHFIVGGRVTTTWGTACRSFSVRKVENHWLRRLARCMTRESKTVSILEQSVSLLTSSKRTKLRPAHLRLQGSRLEGLALPGAVEQGLSWPSVLQKGYITLNVHVDGFENRTSFKF